MNIYVTVLCLTSIASYITLCNGAPLGDADALKKLLDENKEQLMNAAFKAVQQNPKLLVDLQQTVKNNKGLFDLINPNNINNILNDPNTISNINNIIKNPDDVINSINGAIKDPNNILNNLNDLIKVSTPPPELAELSEDVMNALNALSNPRSISSDQLLELVKNISTLITELKQANMSLDSSLVQNEIINLIANRTSLDANTLTALQTLLPSLLNNANNMTAQELVTFLYNNQALISLLLPKNMTNGGDFNIEDMINMAIESYIEENIQDPVIKEHLLKFLPDLIAKLSQTNSSDQAWEIISPVIVAHLAGLLNDSSLLQSPKPYEQAWTIVYNMLMADPNVPEVLKMPQIQLILAKFFANLTAGMDLMLAIECVLPDMEAFINEQILIAIKQYMQEFVPQLYDIVKDETDLQAISDTLISLFETTINEQLKNLSLPFQINSGGVIYNGATPTPAIKIKSLLEKSLEASTQPKDIQEDLNSLTYDLYLLVSNQLLTGFKTFIQENFPDLYDYIKDQDQLVGMIAASIQYLDELVKAELAHFGITIPTKPPTSTTPMATTTSLVVTTTQAVVTTTTQPRTTTTLRTGPGGIDAQIWDQIQNIQQQNAQNIINLFGSTDKPKVPFNIEIE